MGGFCRSKRVRENLSFLFLVGCVVGVQDPLRWLKVASLLPGKNHEDVRHRYQRLIYDVHKIENAMPV